MTDESSNVDTALDKYHDALRDHKNLTTGEIEKIRRELTDSLTHERNATKQEVQELRDALREVTDWKEAEVKAKAEKDKMQSNTTTIVTPPNDVVPDPAQQQSPVDAPAGGDPDGKPRRKKAWWY